MSPAQREPAEAQGVRGERAEAVVNAARTVQSRVSNALAAGLMTVLGLGALTWYYAHTLAHHARAREVAQSTAVSRAQGEMPLPSLGKIEPPRYAAVSGSAPPPAAMPAPEPPLAEAPEGAGGHGAAGAAAPPGGGPAAAAMPAVSSGAGTTQTPRDLVRDRRLGGAVFSRESDSAAPSGAPGHAATPAVTALIAPSMPPAGDSTDSHRGDETREDTLSARLRPGVTPATQARLLPTTRLLLPKGAFIDCTLETAIDSTLPGMTTCITAADTFGADGKVVLLERGTKLVGETRGQVQQGQARVFVLWTEARTPTGVVVALDSPGTDELGRAGLPGEVEHHFWERFGAAMLVSVVNGAVQAGVQASNRSGSAVIYAPSASQDVLTEVLKDTLQIAPTIVKRNGDRIQVLVARDVDFRPVYELHAPAGR
jgi:type IV secretion system protein VirB10